MAKANGTTGENTPTQFSRTVSVEVVDAFWVKYLTSVGGNIPTTTREPFSIPFETHEEAMAAAEQFVVKHPNLVLGIERGVLTRQAFDAMKTAAENPALYMTNGISGGAR